jgi:hypothetical protein
MNDHCDYLGESAFLDHAAIAFAARMMSTGNPSLVLTKQHAEAAFKAARVLYAVKMATGQGAQSAFAGLALGLLLSGIMLAIFHYWTPALTYIGL